MTNIQCKKCAHFTPEWCEYKRDSLDPDLLRDCEFYKGKTIYDKIVRMNIEEMARFIANIEARGYEPTETHLEHVLEWLKQEADGWKT